MNGRMGVYHDNRKLQTKLLFFVVKSNIVEVDEVPWNYDKFFKATSL